MAKFVDLLKAPSTEQFDAEIYVVHAHAQAHSYKALQCHLVPMSATLQSERHSATERQHHFLRISVVVIDRVYYTCLIINGGIKLYFLLYTYVLPMT